jgi:hypothetical protein
MELAVEIIFLKVPDYTLRFVEYDSCSGVCNRISAA